MSSYRQLMEAQKVKRADGFKVRLEHIHERDGFNLRIKDEAFLSKVYDLADHICAGGKIPPLEVYPRDDASGVDLVDGHRRRLALQIARERKSPHVLDKDGVTWVRVEAFDGDERSRKLRIHSSADGEPLRPLETALGYKRLRDEDGMTAIDIAAELRKSHQHVSMLLTVADAPPAVHKLIADDRISLMEAAKHIRAAERKGVDVVQYLRTLMSQAEAAGADKVTNGAVQGKAIPKRLAAASMDAMDFLVASLEPACRVVLAQIIEDPSQFKGVAVTLPAEHLAPLIKAHADIMAARERQAQKSRDKASRSKQQDIADDDEAEA